LGGGKAADNGGRWWINQPDGAILSLIVCDGGGCPFSGIPPFLVWAAGVGLVGWWADMQRG